MRVKEIQKLSRRELRQRADEAFSKADEKGPGYLSEAEFYMRELQNRHDSWVSTRDLFLEVVVIILIGWEIWMGYRAERLQTSNFKEEKAVFESLQKNSAATADTLRSLKETTETMNGMIRKQVELFYDIEVTVAYNRSEKKIILQNQGRTFVTVWGMHFGSAHNFSLFTEGHMIPGAGGMHQSGVEELYNQMKGVGSKADGTIIPFFLFLKNATGQKFTIHGHLLTVWENNDLTFNSQSTQITPGWDIR